MPSGATHPSPSAGVGAVLPPMSRPPVCPLMRATASMSPESLLISAVGMAAPMPKPENCLSSKAV